MCRFARRPGVQDVMSQWYRGQYRIMFDMVEDAPQVRFHCLFIYLFVVASVLHCMRRCWRWLQGPRRGVGP